ncbi:unnamed protein product [Pedinophyceae sp. YPF-701]|nr:unnamed protein product [Pedinophyceae sp. YPF-701]
MSGRGVAKRLQVPARRLLDVVAAGAGDVRGCTALRNHATWVSTAPRSPPNPDRDETDPASMSKVPPWAAGRTDARNTSARCPAATGSPPHGSVRGMASKPGLDNFLTLGSVFEMNRTYSEHDVRSFCGLTGDSNPIHRDKATAKSRGLHAPIVPGLLAAAMFPALIGTNVPGAVYASQSLKFRAPIYVGSRVRAEIEVVKEARRGVVQLATRVWVWRGTHHTALRATADGGTAYTSAERTKHGDGGSSSSAESETEDEWKLAIDGEGLVVVPRDS